MNPPIPLSLRLPTASEIRATSTDPGGMRHPYAIITPSYALDFERCCVLAESVRCHAALDINHYILVDRRDERLSW
ncbi:MAG: hypothetical protein ABI134_25470 [Byssovorax sp.]